jgi:abequosyltransferase
MSNLLTIAIPTFNRAQLLDKQLAWLAGAIRGFEPDCEIIISDNCSTDETPEIIQKWQAVFCNVVFRINRNPQNLGAIRNIAYCINAATSRYVWTISDDDQIGPETLAYVINVLIQYPDLALLVLNFSSRSMTSGQLLSERCFEVANDAVWSNGKEIFEHYLAVPEGAKWGGLALTTALIYRTDLAQQALQTWPSGLNNLTVQLYITAYCALHGSVKVTKDTYLTCMAGTHFFLSDDKMFFTFRYAEIPEAFVKLMQLGCSPQLCRRKVLDQRKEFKRWFVKRCFKQWPLHTVRVFMRYLASIILVNYGVFLFAEQQQLNRFITWIEAIF